MKQFLVAAGQCGANTFAFGRRAPVRCSCHRPGIGGETNSERATAKAFSYQLADVKLATRVHLGGPGIAQMRIVRPDNDFALAAIKVAKQLIQRFEHVLVAQIP